MQDFSCCKTSPNHFIILKLEICIYFYIQKWIFKVILTFFYFVKQYREKKHNMQGRSMTWQKKRCRKFTGNEFHNKYLSTE